VNWRSLLLGRAPVGRAFSCRSDAGRVRRAGYALAPAPSRWLPSASWTYAARGPRDPRRRNHQCVRPPAGLSGEPRHTRLPFHFSPDLDRQSYLILCLSRSTVLAQVLADACPYLGHVQEHCSMMCAQCASRHIAAFIDFTQTIMMGEGRDFDFHPRQLAAARPVPAYSFSGE
jgi:hypothetical protein